MSNLNIVLRSVKGSALTFDEMDENLRDLYEDTDIDRVLSNGDTTTREAKIGGLKISSTLSDSHPSFPIYGNYIAFKGTSNDNQNGDFCYTYIGERIYGAEPRSSSDSRGETSELLFMKLNDTESAGGGSDRIRHYASNHCFDISTTTHAPQSTSANSIEDAVAEGAASDFRAMTIRESGDVLIGKANSSPDVQGIQLSKNGSMVASLGTANLNTYHVRRNSAWKFFVNKDGVVHSTSASIASVSDERLKENIRDLDDGLSKIMQLKPRKFDWKEGKGSGISNDRGFVAQEFEQVFPDMIGEWLDEPPEGEDPYKTVTADLIPVLTKAIQEQQAQIEALTARITELENA